MNETTMMRSSSPAKTNSLKNQKHPNNVNNLTGNQRLRAAASFSKYNYPTSMAVRLTGRCDVASLGAIAGPMGINIVDLAAPQRSLLVLNYCSSVGSTILNNNGISTMSFQPDQSILQCPNYLAESIGRNSAAGTWREHTQSSTILLATARASGILIWDCSGRALSPLLGRLNAADSRSTGPALIENRRSSSQHIAKGDDTASDTVIDQIQPPPLAAAASTLTTNSKTLTSNAAATLDTVQPMLALAPISLERTVSYQSQLSHQSSTATSASVPMSHSINSFSSKGNVTSLAWKGPTVPILLSTCGNSACIWDLRTSLLLGVGGKGGGARPNSRVVSPSQGGDLIHCTYGYDESRHMFSTLDESGVVRIWDDRKAGNEISCLASFVAHSRGVGVASIPPSRMIVRGVDSSIEGGPRWVTWGCEDDDDLTVKVWSPLSAVKPDIDSVGKDGSAANEVRDPYQVTSRISVSNGAAARIHPACADVILVFRTNPPEHETSVEKVTEGSLATGEQLGMQTLEVSPEWRVATGRSPEIAAVISTPPSPPPLMLHDFDERVVNDKSSSTKKHKGWEAELWRIDTGDCDAVIKAECGQRKRDVMGAQMISSFRGGDLGEGALSFVPGRPGANAIDDDIIAIDLSLGKILEGRGKEGHTTSELVLCSLTNKGCLRVYGMPEVVNEECTSDRKEINIMPNMARVYRGSGETYTESSSWWKGKKEEEKKDEGATRASPRNDSLSFDEDTTIDTRNIPVISEEALTKTNDEPLPVVNEDQDVTATQNVPIDPIKAARVPCPPLCGAAFSAGVAGGLVTFSNGPVGKMFAWYKSSDTKLGNVTSLTKPEITIASGTSIILTDFADDNGEEMSSGGRACNTQKLPRTVFDLLETLSAAKVAQWGLEDNDNTNDTLNEDDASGSSDDSYSYEDVEVVIDSESSDSDDGGFFHVSKTYNDYFSASRKSLLGEDADSESNTNKDFGRKSLKGGTDEANKNFAGLSLISPVVFITRKYTDIVLNGQTPELANRLHLGDCWWLAKDFSLPDYGGKNNDIPAASRNENKSSPQRNFSDNAIANTPSWSNDNFDKSLERIWSLQPLQKNSNKQTSMMANIKSLMLPGVAMSTPPDQKLMEKKNVLKSAPSEETSLSKTLQTSDSNKYPLGVFLLENPETPDTAAERLAITRNLCIQNAQVCMDCEQQTKAETWTLLAQTIESLEIFELDAFDGWGGRNDALTIGIVEQILRYYESQADYQMLSTIVCVLTLGRDRRKPSKFIGLKNEGYQLLPKFDDRRFDLYLHHYASLLYGWGCLIVRNEISKRLAYGIPGAGAEIIIATSPGSQGKTASFVTNTGVASGVTFTPMCQKCMTPVDDTNVCRKCKDYAFQCSICCNAVHGACTWCPLCSHGGHAEHIMSWFEGHQMCPTGCGCLCVLGKASRFIDSNIKE